LTECLPTYSYSPASASCSRAVRAPSGRLAQESQKSYADQAAPDFSCADCIAAIRSSICRVRCGLMPSSRSTTISCPR